MKWVLYLRGWEPCYDTPGQKTLSHSDFHVKKKVCGRDQRFSSPSGGGGGDECVGGKCVSPVKDVSYAKDLRFHGRRYCTVESGAAEM